MRPSVDQAAVILDELMRCGVRDVVIGVGSRSAGLALAAARAEDAGRLRLHVRVDERVAGFVALGIGKVTGLPAAVITTSGTAAANLLPAVAEADEAGVPLLILTADRPPMLRDVGANQAMHQVGIFDSFARFSVDLSVPVDEGDRVRYWRSTMARCFAMTRIVGNPGPVHVNVPLAVPLVSESLLENLPSRLDGRARTVPWVVDRRVSSSDRPEWTEVVDGIVDASCDVSRGLIVVGDHDRRDEVDAIDVLAQSMGWPVIGEPSGGAQGAATALAHGPLVCESAAFSTQWVPDLVVTVGRVGLHRAVNRVIDSARLHVAVDSKPLWSDPNRSANVIVAHVPRPGAASPDPSWLSSWRRADDVVATTVSSMLDSDAGSPSGMAIARSVAAAVPSGGQLFLGSSSAVRHVSSFAGRLSGIRVLGNRGTAGIDGCVSTAWGVALGAREASGGPTVALVGDQAFWYDSNAWAVARDEARPDLTVVVADNDGAGIFSQLEQGAPAFEAHFERVFGLPLAVDVARIVDAFQGRVHSASSISDLERTLEAIVGDGVHAVVVKANARVDEAAQLSKVRERIDDALAAL